MAKTQQEAHHQEAQQEVHHQEDYLVEEEVHHREEAYLDKSHLELVGHQAEVFHLANQNQHRVVLLQEIYSAIKMVGHQLLVEAYLLV